MRIISKMILAWWFRLTPLRLTVLQMPHSPGNALPPCPVATTTMTAGTKNPMVADLLLKRCVCVLELAKIYEYMIWGGPKKVSSKSEEKMHSIMKMTSQKAENLGHVQQHGGKYFYTAPHRSLVRLLRTAQDSGLLRTTQDCSGLAPSAALTRSLSLSLCSLPRSWDSE